MTPRRYEMKARAEGRTDTRQRIVEAAIVLHTASGILETSYQQIAALADVSVGTVYNHFPSLDDLVPACGAVLMERLRPPDRGDAARVVAAASTMEGRLAAVARELFAFYERGGAHLHLFPGERDLPAVREWVSDQRATVAAFVREALREREPPRSTLKAVTALFDLETYEALRARGVARKTAEESMVRAALGLLGQE